MKIGRHEIAIGSVQYIITTAISLVVMAVVLTNVSSEEYAIWSVFLAIQSFVVLIDAGFGGVVLRYTSYAYCGAKEILINGTPEMDLEGKTNYPLFFEIYYYAQRIYRRFALIGFGILSVASIYIWYLARQTGNVTEVITAWILFSSAVAVDMYYTYFSNIMKGMGMIRQNATISIVVSIVGFLAKIVLLYSGFGLFGLTISYFIQIAVNRFLMYMFTANLFFDQIDARNSAKKLVKLNSISKTNQAIWKNSSELTLVTISDFLSGKGKTLICSFFFPLSVTAMFSVTSQLIGIVYSIAYLPFSIFRYKFGDSIPHGKTEDTKDVFSFVTGIFLVLMFLGTLVTITFGNWSLELIGSNTRLLSKGLLFLISLYQTITGIVKICTTYIQYKNVQPYIKAIIISNAVSIFVALLTLRLGGGIFWYLIVLVTTQLSYNFWKWFAYVYQDLKITPLEFAKRFTSYSIKIFKGRIS